MKSTRARLASAALLGLAVGAAEAQTSPAAPGSELEEVVITSHYEFLSVDTSGTTNLPLPIEQVPQSISLVTDDFVKAADLKTLGDIADYTPGALNVGNQEGFQTLVKLRGFAVTPALDGINQITAYFEPDNAIYDRVELVKGPSSVVYGVSNPGGVINYVTQEPDLPDTQLPPPAGRQLA